HVRDRPTRRCLEFSARSVAWRKADCMMIRDRGQAREAPAPIGEAGAMGMTWLLVTTIGIGLVADDPAELGEQLGASRYPGRQKAAQSLLEMGREALPALQAGSQARDAEVRDQVRGLLEAIESKLLVEATEVTLDGGEGPLVGAVRELGRRSGMSV